MNKKRNGVLLVGQSAQNSENKTQHRNRMIIYLLLSILTIIMWSKADQVYALDYSSFNSSYPVSVYYPYSS